MGRAAAIAYTVAGLAVLAVSLPGPRPDAGLAVLGALHVLWGLARQARPAGRRPDAALVADALLALSLLYFLFLYVYALNANIDYVQRFVRGGGRLWLAGDTRRERLAAFARCSPLLAAAGWGWAVTRRGPGRFSLLAALVSAGLGALAQPSFARVEGMPLLGWFSFVPLLIALRDCRYGRGVVTVAAYGAFVSLAGQYWLGTFSLVSLQIAMLILTANHLVFAFALVAVLRGLPRVRWIAFALAWTAFEWLRSLGFLGFPWGLVAHAQYRQTALIQAASLTGVWGLSFVVLLVNGALAEAAGALRGARWRRLGEAARPLVAAAAVLLVWIAAGGVALALADTAGRQVRVALIQQNSDPRRTDYEVTFEALVRLTDEAAASDPRLVVWSETAFVPNIRRWGAEQAATGAGAEAPYVLLVRRFRDYQKSLGRWLVTGNDDYSLSTGADGSEVRSDYNAAVLFDDSGARRETYHKVRLVPFTEYFPYRDLLPRVHDLLVAYDVTLWEPGGVRTVFSFPGFRFAAPICFEDIFPDDVRRFVAAGAEVIANLSNDYWSLTPVEAQQHFAAALFRAVENRRPLLRATASGVTAHVDAAGRIVATLPLYVEASLVADVRVGSGTTLYNRLGDWFPAACAVAAAACGVAALAGAALRVVERRRRRPY